MCDNHDRPCGKNLYQIGIQIPKPTTKGASLPGVYSQHTSRLKSKALGAALWLAPVFGWVLWVLDRIGHVTGWWCLGL